MSASPSNPSIPRVTLVLGAASSGKSAYAESLIEAAGGGVYLATAEAGDAEMAERIRRHRERRGRSWSTEEAPLELAAALERIDAGGRPVLVDCLTLWISNLMGEGRDVEAETETLAQLCARLTGPAVLVSNEVGAGIVPDNALARRFRDLAGRVNQRIAAAADRVVLVAAGQPLILKQESARC